MFPGADAFAASVFTWQTVVNNADLAPGGDAERFFSYNQPSVSDSGLVVFRAGARDLVGGELLVAAAEGGGGSGGEPIRGIFTRDMSSAGNPINLVAVNRQTAVPAPNNLDARFNEFPSFPRIDKNGAYAFRGQSPPVWEYTLNGADTRVGTSGLYTNPAGGPLVTGASQLGVVPEFSYFAVPGAPAGTKFDQFPGAPSPTENIVTFKGNWTTDTGGKTGIYFRDSVADAGKSPVQKIAESGMVIPNGGGTSNTNVVFGSTAPPSAAGNKVVFTGLDNEDAPTAGGIYIADIKNNPDLKPLVDFSTKVPGTGTGAPGTEATLNRVGEALSFDGARVGFWGAWGTETKTVTLTCGSEGNAAVVAACIANSDDGKGTSTREVPKNQGIFTVDVTTGAVELVAKTGDPGVEDLLFWNFSGAPPEEGGEDDREPPRWRSTAFVAVDGEKTVFKASAGDVESLMIDYGATNLFETLLSTGMAASLLDLLAPGDALIVELGVERDGFRNNWLAINASFLNEAGESWAGIYLTAVPIPAALPPFGSALAGLVLLGRRRAGRLEGSRS